jgi:DNA-binding response OmpR family regulator
VTSLDGKRVLVLEDEAFVALDLKQLLSDAGAAVVGPTSTLLEAQAAVRQQPIDAAVLDVNLNGEFSYTFADTLSARGVPLMLLTGYDAWSLPAAVRKFPRIAKPFDPRDVVAMVRLLCSGRSNL